MINKKSQNNWKTKIHIQAAVKQKAPNYKFHIFNFYFALGLSNINGITWYPADSKLIMPEIKSKLQ